MTPPIVGIAGVGLIGASIGLRAVARGWDVRGWDPDREHLRAARDLGAVGTAATDFDELAAGADTLVLAAPLDATLALLEGLARTPPRATLILDVASVKAPVGAAAAGLRAFCATHPIAGSERSGPAAARADLFAGRTWTYDPAADSRAVVGAVDFIRAMGAEPYALASDEHDRIVALTSHLPQVLSVVLGARVGPFLDDPSVSALCGTGMQSMLRLGASSWPVWQAILASNGRPIAQEVRTLARVLLSVADALDAGRAHTLATEFAASAGAAARLGANGSAPISVERPTTASDER